MPIYMNGKLVEDPILAKYKEKYKDLTDLELEAVIKDLGWIPDHIEESDWAPTRDVEHYIQLIRLRVFPWYGKKLSERQIELYALSHHCSRFINKVLERDYTEKEIQKLIRDTYKRYLKKQSSSEAK